MRNKLRHPAVGFLLRLILIFAVLIAPWPGWNDIYGSYFRALGRAFFSSETGNRIVLFTVADHAPPDLDTRITLGNRALLDRSGSGLLKRAEFDSRSIGWLPTALTAALILATPLPWPRRVLALAGGLILIHLFIIFSLQSWIWDNSAELSLLSLSNFWQQVASQLDYLLTAQLGASFSVPVVIWILVAFRRQDKFPP